MTFLAEQEAQVAGNMMESENKSDTSKVYSTLQGIHFKESTYEEELQKGKLTT